jgi:transposase
MPRSPSRRQGAPASIDIDQASTPPPPPAVLPAQPLPPPVSIGVGIDTSRYGHHACFLRADLQPAAADLKLVESAAGYQQLRDRLLAIAAPHGGRVHFHVRLDLAGRYADNLLAFLGTLGTPQASNAPLANASFTISCGDPQRNKNYRAAIYGAKKSDPVEAQACARFALTENPKATTPLSAEQRLLGQIASRLESQARQNTRVINQLHNLLARTFPELALLINDISAGWVLALLEHYPTAAKLARAHASSLENIAYLPHEHIPTLLASARTSVASLAGPAAEELVRDLVRQVKDAHVRHKSLEKLLVSSYRRLPPNHLDTIKGFGPVTAAILTAKIVDPHRFAEPGKLVGLFGVFPVEASSGIDRDGKSRLPVRMVMCKRGNDLVRRYLWMAALSAAIHNPAVKPLYQRVRAKHPEQPSIAIGHVMRKLLHLALAVWKSDKPFNPNHYPWDRAAHLPGAPMPASTMPASTAPAAQDQANTQAAGHINPVEPERSVVTAACISTRVTEPVAHHNASAAAGIVDPAMSPAASDIPMSQPAAGPWIDFDHIKAQLPLRRVLEHLQLMDGLRGSNGQLKGPCPLHGPRSAGHKRGRTFSVNLDKNVFQCFLPSCARKGDVIDLWAAVKGVALRQAAVELVQTFQLEPAPEPEKRHG